MDTEKLKSVGIDYSPEIAGGLAGVLAALPGRKRGAFSRLLSALVAGGSVYGGGKLLQRYLNKANAAAAAASAPAAQSATADRGGTTGPSDLQAALAGTGLAGSGMLGYKYRKQLANVLRHPIATGKGAANAVAGAAKGAGKQLKNLATDAIPYQLSWAKKDPKRYLKEVLSGDVAGGAKGAYAATKNKALAGLNYVKNNKLKSGLVAAGLAAGAGAGYGLNKLRNAKYKE